MFFSDPEFDREVLLAFLGASVLIGAIVGVVRKNVWLGLLVASFLANGSVVLTALSGTLMFDSFGMLWLKYFAVYYWPILNIIFLVWYVLYARKKSALPKA